MTGAVFGATGGLSLFFWPPAAFALDSGAVTRVHATCTDATNSKLAMNTATMISPLPPLLLVLTYYNYVYWYTTSTLPLPPRVLLLLLLLLLLLQLHYCY